jgi:hypothetical protein
MKTLSATPRPWYHWKAEDLSFFNELLIRGVTLTSLLIKKRQSWALVGILFDGIVKKIDKEIVLVCSLLRKFADPSLCFLTS